MSEQDAKAINSTGEGSKDVQRDGQKATGRLAPRLQKNAAALQHAFTKHQVGQLLEARPEQNELMTRNILRRDAQGSSSRIQAAQRKLQHHMTTDKVGHLLEKRSEIDSLAHQGILKDTHIAPAIQASSRALEKNLARANLYHALKSRPSVQELQQRGIYGEIPYIEEEGGDGFDPTGESADYILQTQGQGGNEQDSKQNNPGLDPSQLAQHAYHGVNGQGGSQLSASRGTGHPKSQPAQWQDFQQQQQSPVTGEYLILPSTQQHESDVHGVSSGVSGGEVKGSGGAPQAGYQRRSKNFHLTRILLKYVATMADAGEISLQQKGTLKDLIVDQDLAILAVAECFDAEHDLTDLKDSLVHLASSRQ